MSKDDFGGAVYRIYDSSNVLVYIGSSGDPLRRINQHRTKRVVGIPTAKQIRERYHRHEFTFYPTILEARAAEAVAIRKEAPELNQRHVGTWRGLPEGAERFVGIGLTFAEIAAERGMGLVEVATTLDMSMHTFLVKAHGDKFTAGHIIRAASLFGMEPHEVAERFELSVAEGRAA